MPKTYYVCGICGETDEHWDTDGWLVAQKRDAPKGELVIRCPSCRTANSERLAIGFEPEPIFDLEICKRDLKDAEPYESPGADEPLKAIFIGTVFNLCPSHKYYQPFACSNVTDEEAEEDAAWFAQADEELDTIGAWLDSGEGDPCDLFVVTFAKEVEGIFIHKSDQAAINKAEAILQMLEDYPVLDEDDYDRTRADMGEEEEFEERISGPGEYARSTTPP